MKNLFTLFSTLALALTLRAQPATIHGQVLLQNSRIKTGTLQPITGAGIRADSGGSVISDLDGKYSLAFQGIRDMTHARVHAHKHGLVVVNERDLQAATIGAEAPLRIFMADSIALAQEQTLLYDINLKVLTAEKDKFIQRLRSDSATSNATLAELKERFNQEFEHRWAAEDFLNEQLEEVKERLPERVAELVRVNLDFASDRYRRAYAFFREGEMEAALRLFDSLDLDSQDAERRLDALENGGQGFQEASEAIDLSTRQVVDCYRLKAEAHNLKFEYRMAVEVLEKGVALLLRVKRGKEDLEVAKICEDLGNFQKEAGEYEQSLITLSRSKELYVSLLQEDNPIIALSSNYLALTLLELGYYKEALQLEQTALNILSQTDGMQNELLSRVYSNIALLFEDLGNYYEALRAISASIELKEASLHVDSVSLGVSYNFLATFSSDLGFNDQALEFQRKAILLFSTVKNKNNPTLALAFHNLAKILFELHDVEHACLVQINAIELLESSLGPGHPKLAGLYHNWSVMLQSKKDYSNALKAEKIALKVRQTSLPVGHKDITISYNSLGTHFALVHEFDSAITYKLKSLANFKLGEWKNDSIKKLVEKDLISIYYQKGSYLGSQDSFHLAISDFRSALMLDPYNSKIMNKIALCQCGMHDYLGCLATYDEAYRVDSGMVNTYLINTAIALAKLCRFEDAKTKLEILSTKMQEHWLPHRGWAVYFALLGKKELCLDHLELTFKLGYDNWDFLGSEEAFDSIRTMERFGRLLESEPK